MIRPSTSPITMTFGYHPGYPLHNGVHYGLDFAYLPDETVYAPFTGPVLCKPFNGDDGNAIYMQQGDYFIGLCHLEKFLVQSGQVVWAGQPVGIIGDTGAAEGRHLHFAVKYKEEFVDPVTAITPMANVSKEVNMLTSTQVDKVLKMGLQRPPTAAELNNPDYQADVGLLIDTVWNNGGEAAYKISQDPKTPEAKLNQIKEIVGE